MSFVNEVLSYITPNQYIWRAYNTQYVCSIYTQTGGLKHMVCYFSNGLSVLHFINTIDCTINKFDLSDPSSLDKAKKYVYDIIYNFLIA